MEANVGEVINLAGKEIIADHITTNENGQGVSLFQAATIKKTQQVIDDNYSKTQGEIGTLSDSAARIGARVQDEDGYSYLHVYAYNPLKDYSTNWGADYYVNTGYVSANGQTCPVFIPGKKVSYLVSSFRKGTWAIVIRKVNVLDEAWSVDVLLPEPSAGDAPIMQWKKPDGTVVYLNTDVWVIGSFIYDSLDGITGLIINNEGLTPAGFLKNRFMQIMNDCDGVDTADFTNWAVAMKCDAIFKRLAVLEAFISRLDVNFLTVGSGVDSPTGGFFMHLYDSKNGNPPEILAKYNGERLWQINPETGKMYGNFAEVRQYMPYQFEDSLDDTYPMECDFYIPVNAIIVSIKLSSKGKNYRSYSKGAASGGGTITSGVIDNHWTDTRRDALGVSVTKNSYHGIETEEAGSHKHSYKKTDSVGGSNDGTHSHSVSGSSSYQAAEITSSGPSYGSGVANHTHTVKFLVDSSGAHTHSKISYTDTDTEAGGSHKHYIPSDSFVTGVSINSGTNKLTNDQLQHSHSVDTTHSHSLTFGIYESTTPAGVELKCSDDGGSTYGSAVSGMGTGGNVSDLNITSQFSGTGWKAIKFTSTRLGRIQAQLMVELLVTT